MAYGLSDAPLLWYEEADRRLQANDGIQHPLDKCCYMLTDDVDKDKAMHALKEKSISENEIGWQKEAPSNTVGRR